VNQEVFAALAEALAHGEQVALVTIVAATGSTPQRVGAKMLVFPDGRTVGTIGAAATRTTRSGKRARRSRAGVR
jgi:xanthine dehydrogenase accessory factor